MSASASPLPPSLRGVPGDQHVQAGITLEPPQATPPVAQDAATQTARAQFPGNEVRGQVLAYVRKPYTLPDAGRLCWVVSMTPPVATAFGPTGSKEIPARYFPVFIDAQTGRFVSFHYFANADLIGYCGQWSNECLPEFIKLTCGDNAYGSEYA